MKLRCDGDCAIEHVGNDIDDNVGPVNANLHTT